MREERTGPCAALLHGDPVQGHVVALRANRLAIDMAKEHGIGAVGVTDSSHCGAIGLYALEAAQQGLVGTAFTHADSVAVPHGGVCPFFGANPTAIAFPRTGGEPVCLVLATTSIPMNRVMNARREGHPLPPDVAVDQAGEPTTDARAAVAVTPLGGAQYGHKGYAMALMVDILGGPMQPAVVAQLAAELAAEPGAPRMPGDPELDHERERRQSGIPTEPELMHEMQHWSRQLGVTAAGESA